jgi:hypothetical protein
MKFSMILNADLKLLNQEIVFGFLIHQQSLYTHQFIH